MDINRFITFNWTLLFLRYFGIKYKLDNGVNPSLVDNESSEDLSFAPGQKVN